MPLSRKPVLPWDLDGVDWSSAIQRRSGEGTLGQSTPPAQRGSAYPYAVGVDPTYDAFAASYDYRRTAASTDASARRAKAQDDYNAALADLELQGRSGRQNLTTSMLQRGVFNSGERHRRGAELEAGLLTARSAADTSLAGLQGQITSDLDRALAQLELDREQAIAGAVSRVTERERRDAELAAASAQAAAAVPAAVEVEAPVAAPAMAPAAPGRSSLPGRSSINFSANKAFSSFGKKPKAVAAPSVQRGSVRYS